MKKLYKTSSKKGFTLLEVMLAVAIMAITSTMIMEGFLAVMNSARNSTIYSRVGGSHHKDLIEWVSSNSRETKASLRDYTGGTIQGLSFSGISTKVYVRRLGTSTDTINIAAATGNQREADINASVVDNRAAFFYVPTNSNGEMECARHHVGFFRYCYMAGDNVPEAWSQPEFRCVYPINDTNHPEIDYCFQYGEGSGESET